MTWHVTQTLPGWLIVTEELYHGEATTAEMWRLLVCRAAVICRVLRLTKALTSAMVTQWAASCLCAHAMICVMVMIPALDLTITLTMRHTEAPLAGYTLKLETSSRQLWPCPTTPR